MAQASAATRPAAGRPNARLRLANATHAPRSKSVASPNAMSGNGAALPPKGSAAADRTSVKSGVVVPSTRSPGLKTNPLPASRLRA